MRVRTENWLGLVGSMSDINSMVKGVGAATGESWADIVGHVGRYRSTHLDDEQWGRFASRLRELVLASQPTSWADARNTLGALSWLVAGTDNGASSVDELLSEANVAAWSNRSSHQLDRRTLTNHVARIARVQRVQRGLPAQIRRVESTKVRPAGFSPDDLTELLQLARDTGEHAARGFAACFGVGQLELISGTFTRSDDGWWLVHPNGERRMALPIVESVCDVFGDGRVRDGDVGVFRRAATAIGIRVDGPVVRQTYRGLVMSEPVPATRLLVDYAVSYDAIDAARRHLPDLDLTTPEIASMLRGPESSACTPRRSSHVRRRPPVSGDSKGRAVTQGRKVTKTEAKRRAAEVREQMAATPELAPAFRALVENYEPLDITADTWAAIRDVFMHVIHRGGIKGAESFKKHRVVIAGFLAWLHERHRSLDIPTAFTYQTIDAYYVDGLDGMETNTRNDYRSRLKNVARRVNPGLDTPIPVSKGRVSIRPGYNPAEEAAIQRVVTRQRRRETRRRACLVVGLGGGGGLDAIDIRNQQRLGIIDRGDNGIVVKVAGPKPRTVIIRREYEALVRIGIEGLKANDFVLKNNGPQSQNPVGRALDDVEHFDDTPRIDVGRLRSTWLAWLMNRPVPVRVILQAAGLQSARTLSDLLPHLPAADSADLAWLTESSAS